MVKTSLSKTHFCAATKISGTFRGNSPVCMLLTCSKDSYLLHKDLIDSVLQFIDSHSLYSSLEYVLEHLNKKILKSSAKDAFTLTIVQKEGSVLKVAGYPLTFMHYPDTSRGGMGFSSTPLTYADTNRLFSEVLEINTGISPILRITLGQDSGSQPMLRVERNKISISFPNAVSKFVETLSDRFSRPKSSRQHHEVVGSSSKIRLYVRYGLALVIIFFTISTLTKALSNKALVDHQISSQPWNNTVQLSASLVVSIPEKLPSKYVHEQVSMIQSGNYLFTYQTDPNIILQIDEHAEIKPIVLDSEQIGKLTGMKKLSNELLVFTHTKSGLIFLNYDKRQWRLVKFAQPKIGEYTDIAMYNDFVYVLDARNRQIWKLEITEDSITGNPWVKDSRVDLSLASSITIDGSVYLTMITGDIVKLTQGKRDASFVLDSKLSPTLRSADAIVFPKDETVQSIYVLDRVEKRIVELSRSGDFKHQYKIDLQLPPDAILPSTSGEFIALVRDQVVTLKPIAVSE